MKLFNSAIAYILGFIIIVSFTGCKKPVEACFSHHMGFGHLEVRFNASCSENAAAYDWDFGFGTSGVISEKHTMFYPSAGTYNVTLRITSREGEFSTITKSVEVY